MKLLGAIAVVVALLQNAAITRAAQISLTKSAEVSQGQIVEIKVSGRDIAAITGRMGKEKIYFYPMNNHGFASLVGADVEARPGTAKLFLTLTDQAGTEHHREIALKVKARTFHTESFNVPPGFDQMSPETLEEIRREQAAFAKVFATPWRERLWDGLFI